MGRLLLILGDFFSGEVYSEPRRGRVRSSNPLPKLAQQQEEHEQHERKHRHNPQTGGPSPSIDDLLAFDDSKDGICRTATIRPNG